MINQSTGGKVNYRPSFNKQIRDKITKKRLNFVAPTISNCSATTMDSNTTDAALITSLNSNSGSHIELQQSIELTINNDAVDLGIPDELLTEWPDDEITEIDYKQSTPEQSTKDELSIEEQCTEIEKELEIKRQRILQYHKHLAEVDKLKSAILIWENGCRQSIIELQKRIQPPQDVATIFRHFNIKLDLDM